MLKYLFIEVLRCLRYQKSFRIPKFSHGSRPPITVFLEYKPGRFYLRKNFLAKGKETETETETETEGIAYYFPFKDHDEP